MTETWTYYDANTIQVTGDFTSKYTANQIIKITQTTVKYFVITAVNLVSGNTRLTISGGGIYVLTDAPITTRAMAPNKPFSELPLGFYAASEIERVDSKTTPVDADEILIRDSVTPFGLRQLTWTNMKVTLKSYFDGLYSLTGHTHTNELPSTTAENDVIMGDATHAWVKKTIADLKTALGLGTAAYVAENLYALLAGRSGGQTIEGGTAANEDLTLSSTHHATKGKIIFGTSAYDQVNNRLGIGKNDPTVPCDINGALRQYGDYAYLGYFNAGNGPTRPVPGNHLAIAWNYGAGQRDVDLWNTDIENSSLQSFVFKQLLSASSHRDLVIFYASGAIWVADNCSALSFTDRTPAYVGDALAEIRKIMPDGKGRIDHATLPEFARHTRIEKDANGKETEVTERNLGNMISILTKAVQELDAKNRELEDKIEKMAATKKAGK